MKRKKIIFIIFFIGLAPCSMSRLTSNLSIGNRIIWTIEPKVQRQDEAWVSFDSKKKRREMKNGKQKTNFGIGEQQINKLSNSNQPIEPYINKTTHIKSYGKKRKNIHKTIVSNGKRNNNEDGEKTTTRVERGEAHQLTMIAWQAAERELKKSMPANR